MLQCFQEVVSPACLLQHGTPPGRPLVSLRCASLSSADCPAALECSRTPPSAFGKSRNPRQIAYRRPHPLCSGSNTASTVTSTDTRFRWTSSLSKNHMLDEALSEVIQAASAPLRDADQQADIAVVFVSGAHASLDSTGRITLQLREHIPSLRCIFGASGIGVIGSLDGEPHEAESRAGISLCLGSLPGVEAHTVHVTAENLPDADASPEEWQRLVGVPIDTHRHINLLLAGGVTFQSMQDLLAGLDFAYPEATKLGGLCSGLPQHLPNRGEAGSAASARPAWPAFCWNADPAASTPASGVITDGCGMLVLHGNVVVEPLISQGCRSMSGSTWSITKINKNLVMEVACTKGGRRHTSTPLRALQRDLDGLPTDDRRQVASNVTVALACDDFKEEDKLEAGDFVVRALVGASPTTGALLIAAEPHLGQRIRFLVRDKEGAMRDMQDHGLAHKRRALQASLEGKPEAPAFGALMFTCNGRGSRLFGEEHPHFDARTLHDFVPVPCAGFFCNGEIGQVGKSTYLHGFTCAAGILRELPYDDS